MAKKYTLPRHTNLAKVTSRFGAAIVDLATVVAAFLIFFYAIFSTTVGQFVINPIKQELTQYEYDSNLVTTNEHDEIVVWKSDDDYKVYDDALNYFYFHYLSGEPVKDEERKASYPINYVPSPNSEEVFTNEDGTTYKLRDMFTVEWYNRNVLGIDRDDPDSELSQCYFTYVKNGESYDKTQIGVPRIQRYDSSKNAQVDITATDLAKIIGKEYEKAYRTLTNFTFYKDKVSRANLFTSIEVGSSLILSGMVFYVIIPMIRKNGETLGKMLFKIRLAHMSGYSHHKYQLIFRFTPYLVTVLAATFIPFGSIYVILLIVSVMFLISFALAMASPKKTALHDFVAQTIVVSSDSIIFDTQTDELAYITEEDGVPLETFEAGEEPEISYEK